MAAAEQIVVDVQAETSVEKPKYERVPKLSDEQQRSFNKAFARREAKLRREYEARIAQIEPMYRDLMDTAEITQQLLERCKDRISVEDQVAILDGLQAIRKEYGEKKWQKR